jgi:hypothetical protein
MVYELAVVNMAPAHCPGISLSLPRSRSSLIDSSSVGVTPKRRPRAGSCRATAGGHKIRAVSRQPRAAIDRLQPYHRRQDPASRALLPLEELSNIDKHRTLHFTTFQQVESRYRIVGTDVRRIRSIQAFPAPFKPDAILARADVEVANWPNPHVHMECQIAADVAFEYKTQARSVARAPVLDVGSA